MESRGAQSYAVLRPRPISPLGSLARSPARLVLLAFASLLLPSTAGTATFPGALANLSKVRIVISLNAGRVEGESLTEDLLRDEVTVLLRAKLPQLALTGDRSASFLWIEGTIDQVSTGIGKTGYYGAIVSQLNRPGIIEAAQRPAMVVVWLRYATLVGPPGRARGQIREMLDQMLTWLAAGWYRDNP